MKVASVTLILLVILSIPFQRAHARVKKLSAPLRGKVVLRDAPDKYGAQVFSLEMPEAEGVADQKRLREIKALIKSKYQVFKKTQPERTTSSVMPPMVVKSFVPDGDGGIPPDNYTAVSKGGDAVTVMNSIISVHDTAGVFKGRKTLSAFTSAVGLNSVNDFRYDPKVVYDPVADRFVSIILDGEDRYNYVILGFSQTNDPTGTWNFYTFYGDFAADSTWFDYPAIAITQNEVFFTGNKVSYDSTWQAGFTQSVIYQVRKQDGYSGNATVTYQLWDSIQYDNLYLRCLYPLNPGDSQQGPKQYFLSNRDFEVSNDSVFLVAIADTIGSTDNTLSVTPIIASCTYGIPPDAAQPDTSVTLATNDDRVLGGFITSNEIQFVCTSVDTVTGGSCIFHGVISNYNTAPVLTARLFSIDTLDFGYPNISFTGNVFGVNQSIISFEYSGLNTYPGFGAILFDGNNYSDMTIIRSGTASVNLLAQREQRWGDYSGSQPEWNSPGSVWVEGIFGTSGNTYGDFLAKLASPYSEAANNVTLPAIPTRLYPNPSAKMVNFEFTVVLEQGFSFDIYDLTGRVVDHLSDFYCRAGKNVVQFDISPLRPGTYVLKAMGKNGESIAVQSFVRP